MQLIEEELDRTLRSGSDQGQKSFLPAIPSASGQDGGKKKNGTTSGSVDTEDEGILADRQSFGYNDDDTHTISSHDQDRDSDSEGRSGSRGRSRQRTYKGSGPRSHTTGSALDLDDDDDRSGYTSSQRTERKGRLYKAPAPFKLKQRKRRMMQSQSPFTTDRNLGVPTGPGFKVKQSSKDATKFVDFERKGSTWKEPSKFEIQRSGKDSTKFWSPRSQKKKKHHEKRGRHTSPDSGLDSDKMAGTKTGNDTTRLEGIAEDRQKLKSFPDADEYANKEDEVLTFMSTIKSDTDVTGKIVHTRPVVEEEQLLESLKESEDTSPVSKDTENQLNVSAEGKDLNVSHEEEEKNFLQHSISISSWEQKFGITHNASEFTNLDVNSHSDVVEESFQIDHVSKLSNDADSLSQDIKHDSQSELAVHSDLKEFEDSVSQKYEDFVNYIHNASQKIVTEKELRPKGSAVSETSSTSNKCCSVDVDTHNATNNEYILTNLAYSKQNIQNISEELRDLVYSENSGVLTESQTKTNNSSDEERQECNSTTATCDFSHSALQQDLTFDPGPERDSDLRLHIRSFGESVKEDDQESVMPPTLVPEKPKPQLVSTPSSQRIATEIESSPLSSPLSLAPDILTWSKFATGSKVTTPPVLPHIAERPPPVKKEKVKKVRREVKDHEKTEKRQLVNGDRTESNDFSQVHVEQEQEVTLISSNDELPPLTNGHIESPELPPMEIPPLPEYVEEKKEVKAKEDKRTLIKPLPKPKEAKLPPPPTLKGPKKSVLKTGPKKKTRVPSAEAPVTQEELNDMTDPLDFLTKYCIIHMDRLPFYERIFSNVVETQTPRYERVQPLSPRTGMPLAQSEMPQWGKHELSMFRDLVVISRGQDPDKIGLSPPEQYLEKICYTLEILTDKRKDICACLGELESTKIKKLAEKAKEVIKDIIKPNFTPKAPKKGKKKKKKKGQQSTEEPEAPTPRLTLNDITDEIIVSRIDEKTMKMLSKEADICQINLEMERCNEKLDHIEERMLHLDGEKNILGMYCMEVYFLEQLNNQKPVEFRRAQSALYNKVHPSPDIEMNVDELEGSLQIINNNLLSNKEFEYLFHVLNLPGRRKLNFKLFSIVAALSEKVTQMDPVVRKLINKMDYHALDHKMNRSKDLFALLCDGEPTPRGNATASNLAVELTAGGLTPEHVRVVLSKFNREGSGYIDFMDFVMYIPLFIEIHERIVQNPLDVKFTL
ncbi:LOW QUALITY PROTEIN: uncharacterized protein LOC117316587 [Pecten maximus]|uniref:LOW QUALITY PROTEIN: uncharacterized protein LOC117316587 n=1 Tax=Pecten maximus TaxID=6579 RepID=UPI001458DFB4|nr:LOW QUALITY PROTEIN: uncharacterized protein LOC117316587 [Pecten maximus]